MPVWEEAIVCWYEVVQFANRGDKEGWDQGGKKLRIQLTNSLKSRPFGPVKGFINWQDHSVSKYYGHEKMFTSKKLTFIVICLLIFWQHFRSPGSRNRF